MTGNARQTEVGGPDSERNADWMSKELEDNLKTFNDRFMETLTVSLTKQLGFDISAAVEKQRKETIGSSFIERKTSSESFLDLKFGSQLN